MKNKLFYLSLIAAFVVAIFEDVPKDGYNYAFFGSVLGALSNFGNSIIGTIGNSALGALGGVSNDFFTKLFGGNTSQDLLNQQREYNWNMMMQQYKNQLELQRQQQGYNTSMAYRSNQWQNEYLKKMQDYATAQWNAQFNKEANYNSPVAQVKRLQDAGFNPSVLMGNFGQIGGAASGSSVASPSVSAPTAASGLGSAAGALPIDYSSFGLAESERLKNLSEMAKINVMLPAEKDEKIANADKLRAEMEKLLSERDLNEAYQTGTELDNALKQTFGYDEAKAKLDALRTQIDYFALKGDLTEAQTALTKVQKALADEDVKSAVEHNRRIGEILQKYIDNLQSITELNKAKTVTEGSIRGELDTRSALNVANTKTLDSVRDFKSSYEKAVSEQESIKSWLAQKTKDGQLDALISGLEADDALSQEKRTRAINELRKLKKIQSSYNNSQTKLEVDAALQNLFDIIGLHTSVGVSNK